MLPFKKILSIDKIDSITKVYTTVLDVLTTQWLDVCHWKITQGLLVNLNNLYYKLWLFHMKTEAELG